MELCLQFFSPPLQVGVQEVCLSCTPTFFAQTLESMKPASVVIAVACMALIIVFYYRTDPSVAWWMPQCPFLRLTGLYCPGCGAQRALHALLSGNFAEAFRFNPFLLSIVPLLAALLTVRCLAQGKIRQYINHYLPPRCIFFMLAVATAAWWLLRNFLWDR